MTCHLSRLLLAALIAATGTLAVAQPMGGPMQGRRGPIDPAVMQQRQEQRLAALKAQLNITPAQEAAWTSFAATMQSLAEQRRINRAEFAKLTTPQRLDWMQEHAATRDAHMQLRSEAIKTLYTQLTPEQQKIFDQYTLRGGGRGGMQRWNNTNQR